MIARSLLAGVGMMLAASVAFAAPVDAPVLSPSEIVAAAPAADWVAIAPADLLVMDLAPNAAGKPRRVVIQLMAPPFSQGWVGNIRKLAAAHWWDGTSINRVQDNYVVQWGDANAEDKTNARPLPSVLTTNSATSYVIGDNPSPSYCGYHVCPPASIKISGPRLYNAGNSQANTFFNGWAVALSGNQAWPVHCYGTVGVGRDMPPDTGSGAELYAVIGQAPRHLDRNLAVVGRVIDGIEHLSSLPRGTGDLGFYEHAEERVPIVSIRVGDQVPGLPHYQYLSTDTASFVRYADARANRRDRFFIVPAGGADICNVPVPVQRVK